ncbi:uncharacterized protein LOC128884246 isoform X2 [Hylaeus volcanicus]|uniref:uncharacterized protein LOC128884246 isoform X2 n=1 Tax=Hylaeus volcanicus TaxID=313075 RepID=UPI0023B8305B|nr:uncharacterized protein LOC128884246 isoform X2 [Hylaeus volcanicus]
MHETKNVIETKFNQFEPNSNSFSNLPHLILQEANKKINFEEPSQEWSIHMSSVAILDEFFTQEAILDKEELTFFLSLAQLQNECYKSENSPGLRLPEKFFETLSDIESRIDNITEADILQRILATAEEQRDSLTAALKSANNEDTPIILEQ